MEEGEGMEGAGLSGPVLPRDSPQTHPRVNRVTVCLCPRSGGWEVPGIPQRGGHLGQWLYKAEALQTLIKREVAKSKVKRKTPSWHRQSTIHGFETRIFRWQRKMLFLSLSSKNKAIFHPCPLAGLFLPAPHFEHKHILALPRAQPAFSRAGGKCSSRALPPWPVLGPGCSACPPRPPPVPPSLLPLPPPHTHTDCPGLLTPGSLPCRPHKVELPATRPEDQGEGKGSPLP